MAEIIIKVEKKDVNTSKIGENIMIHCGNIDVVFDTEALDELIRDYKAIKIQDKKK